MSTKYKEAGVNLEAGYESVERIKKHVKRTGAVQMFGNFGGVFDLSNENYKEPVLVSGTDGVGTKLEIAFQTDKHDTIGIDLVAMCVNDIICQGADPLYFLDYIATGKNEPIKIENIVKGVADGCVQSGCSLIGGETAEMPDIYQENHYDLAGFVVGCVEKKELIDGLSIKSGDTLVGIPSSGIHSNGYSLVRKIFFKDNNYNLNEIYAPLEIPLGEELLKPTRIYAKEVKEVKEFAKGIIHVTGGGFQENIPRILPEGLGVEIKKGSYNILPIFELLSKAGNIKEEEMHNIFNMGIGMIIVTDQPEKVIEKIEGATAIGEVVSNSGVKLVWKK